MNDRIVKAIDSLKNISKNSGWASRKLLITVGAGCALLWLVQGNVAAILDSLVKLLALYLICCTVEDVVQHVTSAWTRNKALELMAKDGLTGDETSQVLEGKGPETRRLPTLG